MKTARIFRSGNSQAVRIPKEFQMQGDEVQIERKEGRPAVRGEAWGEPTLGRERR